MKTASPPRARIIAVGDELLLGRTQDTNTAYLARWCQDRGIGVQGAQIVGDQEASLASAICQAAADSQLLLLCGGLGPTLDDRTRHAVAAATGRELREHAAAWKAICAYYQRIRPGQTTPQSNQRQALIPRGARLLRNSCGTAPGFFCRHGGAWIVCLPGVPSEMRAMLGVLESHLAKLLNLVPPAHVAELYCAGLGESMIQDRLGALLESQARLQVGITVHAIGHCTIRVVGAQRPVQQRIAALRRLLQQELLPADGLAASLVQHLRSRQERVSIAESCTCGHILAALGRASGASAILEEGIIAYANRVKMQRLRVSDRILAEEGAVSEACAAAMAEGQRLRSAADYALASTGIAGPEGGSPERPVGTVWIAVSSRQGLSTRQLRLSGQREQIQARAAARALHLLWQHCSQGPQPS